MSARLRSDVDDIVGSQHHILVVFNHNHRVAHVSQLFERSNEPFVVALVKTNGRLVENVEHIHQLRANLCGKSDALTFSARERSRLSVQGQVVESHLKQEVHARANLLHNFGSNLLLHGFHVFFNVLQPLLQFVDVEVRHLRYVLVPDLIGQRLSFQPHALALGALASGQKLVGPLLCILRIVVVHHLTQIFDNPLEGHEVVARCVNEFLVDAHVFERAVEHFVHHFVGNLLHGSLQCAFIFFEQCRNLPEYHLVFVFAERHDGTLIDAELVVGNHLFQVNLVHNPQSFAPWASPFRRIEREDVGCRVAVRDACHGVHQLFRVVAHGPRVFLHDHECAFALFHGHAHTGFQALVVFPLHLQFVYYHLNVVVLIPVYLHSAGYLQQFSINADVEIAFAPHVLEEFAVVSFALSHQGGENVDGLVVVFVENHAEHLFFGILHHFLARHIRIGRSGSGIEQSQVVVNLGGGSNGRAWVFVGCFLFDADNRRESGYLVNIGPLHVAQEVSGIGRKGFDVSALSFGKDGVEGQRRLSRARKSGNHR